MQPPSQFRQLLQIQTKSDESMLNNRHNPQMKQTIFLTLSQHISENNLKVKKIETLKEKLFTKTLEDGKQVDVQGVHFLDANGNEVEVMALAKALNGKKSDELAQMARNLSVAKQTYDHINEDGEKEERTMLILCPSNVREGSGDAADLLF